MSFKIPGIKNAAPAIVMAAGAVPMVASNSPEHVRYGGACLIAVALILADLQNGKKMGYSDKIVNAVRKIPGLENADEGTVIGMLTLSASAFLGGGEAMNIAENGYTVPGLLKVGYNTINYPLSASFDFQRSRALMERYFGKELSFKYKDADGKEQKTAPIPTSRLLQQLALISGAAGITTYGTMLDVATIQFTGVMFALSNGMNIANLVNQPISDVTNAKLGALRKRLSGSDEAQSAEFSTAQQQWQEVKNVFTGDSAATSIEKPQAEVSTETIAKSVVDAIDPIVAQAYTPPDQQPKIG